MSVLIKGIDLPEAYTSVWLTVFECVGEHTFVKTHKVSAEQIQAIPPHGHLIDAEVLWDTLRYGYDVDLSELPETLAALLEMIDHQDTIIEAEEGEEA